MILGELVEEREFRSRCIRLEKGCLFVSLLALCLVKNFPLWPCIEALNYKMMTEVLNYVLFRLQFREG